MKGDRITAVSSIMFNTEGEVLPVYDLQRNPDGSIVTAFDGSVVLRRIGGVKSGSTGVVVDEPIKVHKSQLLHLQGQTTSLGGTNDFLPVYPIFFDTYQLLGWLPADHMRVTGGGRV